MDFNCFLRNLESYMVLICLDSPLKLCIINTIIFNSKNGYFHRTPMNGEYFSLAIFTNKHATTYQITLFMSNKILRNSDDAKQKSKMDAVFDFQHHNHQKRKTKTKKTKNRIFTCHFCIDSTNKMQWKLCVARVWERDTQTQFQLNFLRNIYIPMMVLLFSESFVNESSQWNIFKTLFDSIRSISNEIKIKWVHFIRFSFYHLSALLNETMTASTRIHCELQCNFHFSDIIFYVYTEKIYSIYETWIMAL